MRKLYIISKTYTASMCFRAKQLISTFEYDDWVYVRGVDTLRGLRDIDVYFTADWIERDDFQRLKEELRITGWRRPWYRKTALCEYFDDILKEL